ncbi:hypothetical protein [Leptolyngbya sp. CCNP1308]|uniref:hypothetical protein n=1 Tax=Leptolyngbya sp. CCNP1308 TaxID=3110255 RepID=UPI003A598CDC
MSYGLGAHVEDLVLLGNANLNGAGNNLPNYIWGNVGNNTLLGEGGADNLYGGDGADRLFGGYGSDFFEW